MSKHRRRSSLANLCRDLLRSMLGPNPAAKHRRCPAFVWSRTAPYKCAACFEPYWDHEHECVSRPDRQFIRRISPVRADRVRARSGA